MKVYRMVVEVEVEDGGINESYPNPQRVRQWVSKTLGANMGHQRDKGTPIKVKGLSVGKAENTGRSIL